ncbi:unnamed protein product [Lampetra planeri]
MAERLEGVDIAIVGIYFVLVFAVGVWAMRRSNRASVSGYFLAGRAMAWLPVGASLFVSNIGSEHFIGLAGSGAASGLAVAAWELNALLLLQLLSWVFYPVYLATGVCTMPGYLARRFGGRRLRVYLVVLSLLLYVLTKVSVDLYAGAVFIQQSLGWDLYVSIVSLIGATALLTMAGGLAAVIYTDTLQAALMVAGALTLMVLGLIKVGGLQNVWSGYMEAVPNVTAIRAAYNLSAGPLCEEAIARPHANSLKVLRGPWDSETPWPGFLLGQTPASIWYWCTDQVIVQRMLAARDHSNAKGATLLAGALKILPMFAIVVPGMIARILMPDELACVSPEHCTAVCGNPAGCSNVAYPRLVLAVMPTGLRGLMMAVIVAALMSDLDSIFNSASSIFTLDIYRHARGASRVSSRELMIVGRLWVVVMMAVSVAWVPVVVSMQGGQMFLYIQEMAGYLTPPVAAIFLLGVFWKRCNEKGAFCGGLVGSTLGFARLLLAFVYPPPDCTQPHDDRPFVVRSIHYMYTAAALFWTTVAVGIIASLLSDPPSRECVANTTFWTYSDPPATSSPSSSTADDDDDYDGDGKKRKRALGNGVTCAETLKLVRKGGERAAAPTCASADDRDGDDGSRPPVVVVVVVTENGRPQPAPTPTPDSAAETPDNGGAAAVDEEWPLGGERSRRAGGARDGSGRRENVRRGLLKAVNWLCGTGRDPDEAGGDGAPGKPSVGLLGEDLAQRLRLLEERPVDKAVLNVGLCLICSVGVFLYVYFSV